MSSSLKKPQLEGVMLFGPLSEKGISLQRYHHTPSSLLTIPDRFQNGSLILFLNICGHAHVSSHCKKDPLKTYHLPLGPQTVISQIKKNASLSLERAANEEHRFFILEITHDWLTSLVKEHPHPIKKEITSFFKSASGKTKPLLSPFCSNIRSLGEELFLPHHHEDRPSLWFYAKILELVSHALLEPSENFCCHRKERLALQRIESVKKSLSLDLSNPPSLAECARTASCSPAYLSRTFSQYTGMTISRYLRNLRLEKAATLLRSGNYNVTEAAMAVGYSSLSHFSKAFSEMFDTCPCTFGFHKGIC